MGQSTDGILFYGIHFEEDAELPWNREDDVDNEEWITELYGLPKPEEGWSEETRVVYDEYWGKQKEIIKEVGIVIGVHCSCDYPMYYVGIAESLVQNSRGEALPIFITQDKKEEWNQRLQAFLKKAGIDGVEVFDSDKHTGRGERFKKIGWWLVSLWC